MGKGKIFIVSGPSGVGKSTVLKTLFERNSNLYFSVSATTRAPREGETDGVSYHFLDRETFQAWIDRDEFLEYAEYVGNYYGTPRKYVDEAAEAGRDAVLDIEIQGARQVMSRRPEAVSVFIAPPSWEELERRLTARGTDTPEKIRQRLERAREELRGAPEYKYCVVNGTAEEAAAELAAIITAEHCKSAERLDGLL